MPAPLTIFSLALGFSKMESEIKGSKVNQKKKQNSDTDMRKQNLR